MDFVISLSEKLDVRLVRSIAVGITAAVVQVSVFETIGVYLHLFPLSTAAMCSAEFGILTNFYLNHRFSFHDRKHAISLTSRLLRFHLVVSGSVFLQWLFVFVAERQTRDYLLIHAAYASAIVLGFCWNYTMYHLVVWRQIPSQTAHSGQSSIH